jgi:hypothetical protein
MYGKKHTQAAKDKMSKAAIGRKHTNKTKKKMSINAKNRTKHPRAKKINIYNQKNKLMFNCCGNFKPFCSENNLPYESLKKTYRKNTKLSFELRCGCSRAFIDKYNRYDGWYARVIV